MNRALHPKTAAKALGLSIAAIAISFILFGFPGICGQVGGLIPDGPNTPEWLGYAGFLTLAASTLSLPISAVYLLTTVILRLIHPKSELQ